MAIRKGICETSIQLSLESLDCVTNTSRCPSSTNLDSWAADSTWTGWKYDKAACWVRKSRFDPAINVPLSSDRKTNCPFWREGWDSRMVCWIAARFSSPTIVRPSCIFREIKTVRNPEIGEIMSPEIYSCVGLDRMWLISAWYWLVCSAPDLFGMVIIICPWGSITKKDEK